MKKASQNSLKYGYTTGTHTTAIVKAALQQLLGNVEYVIGSDNLISTPLPIEFEGKQFAEIKIDELLTCHGYIKSVTTKTNNDDLDVTKGCTIISYLSYNYEQVKQLIPNQKQHPHLISYRGNQLYLYAGEGIGIVTKKGLKVPIGYPAINPVPIKMIEQIFMELTDKISNKNELHCVLEITDGEKLSEQTANPKIGINGGLSILGTTGIVKPISSEAYLETIKIEIAVANMSHSPVLIFTLGNSSFQFAEKHFNVKGESIIETGNFIYDSLAMLSDTYFRELIFVANSGKMTKLAQGLKNTHNRYGEIDFNLLKAWVTNENIELVDDIKEKDFSTTKALIEYIDSCSHNQFTSGDFLQLLCDKAVKQLAIWMNEISLQHHLAIKNLQAVCLNGDRYFSSSINRLE